ncbi:hypothetical protein FRC17_003442 [Serendipita sp. 399]|nr:hypothetical protein FRC17_003442 [Serendipita sp. 399]
MSTSKPDVLAEANDLILGAFSRVPPSPELDHAVRFLSTWSGSDKFFMLLENSAKLLVPLLEMRARMEYRNGVRKIPSSSSSARWKKLGSVISDARTLLRLWGLLPIFQWLISLERSPPPTRKLLTIERLQGLSMLAYYPLEHLYYLGSKGVLPISNEKIGKYSLWSTRAWAFYVCLQFLHLKEDWKLLKRREKALAKDTGSLGEKGRLSVEQENLRAELLRRKDAILNELIVNIGYLPLTVHWSLKGGLFKNDIWVHLFGMVAALASFRGSWIASAAPLAQLAHMAAQVEGARAKTLQSATSRIPVEIWKTILSLATHPGPLIPSVNDGLIENCNVFAETCIQVASYRESELTRARLRLVCTSWNAYLAGVQHKIVCVPAYPHHPVERPGDEALANAERLCFVMPFTCVCETPCPLSVRWRKDKSSKWEPIRYQGANNALTMIKNAPGLSAYVIYDIMSESDFSQWADALPGLRAMSLKDTGHSQDDISETVRANFPHLTHLEINNIRPWSLQSGLDIPSLTTLSLRLKVHSRVDWGLQGIFSLPSLRYLHIKGAFDDGFNKTHLEPLLLSTGRDLRGLSITQDISRDHPRGFDFPEEIWQRCPNLEWIGGTARSLLYIPKPPPSVPLRVIYITGIYGVDWTMGLSDDNHVRETPEMVASTARWATQTDNNELPYFQLRWSWERFMLRYHHKPPHYRAEWINFLIQFGLFGKRHGQQPLKDVDGVRLDDDRTLWVRQRIQMDAVVLAQHLKTTSWTNHFSKHTHFQI